MERKFPRIVSVLYPLPVLLCLAAVACSGGSGCGQQQNQASCGAGTVGQKQSDGSCQCVPNNNNLTSNCP